MPVIDWNDNYSLGISQIDEHHRYLFDLLNATYDVLVSKGQKVEVEQVIEELINYATYHFTAEEQLIFRHFYPQAESHRKEHEYFIDQISMFQHDFMQGRKTLSLELIVFLKDWLSNHILVMDKHFARTIAPQVGAGEINGITIRMD